MSQFPRWKSITVLVALIFGILFALPNLYGTDPSGATLAARNYEARSHRRRRRRSKPFCATSTWLSWTVISRMGSSRCASA